MKMKIETVLEYYSEPRQMDGEIWVMKPKLEGMETLFSCSYFACLKRAEKEIETILKKRMIS